MVTCCLLTSCISCLSLNEKLPSELQLCVLSVTRGQRSELADLLETPERDWQPKNPCYLQLGCQRQLFFLCRNVLFRSEFTSEIGFILLFHRCRLTSTHFLCLASVEMNDSSALLVWLGPTCRCAATGRSGLMAETDKLETSQASQRLPFGAVASRSHTMSHAPRPLCCYLSCAATCHLFHSGPWVMGSPRGRGLGSSPPCGVKRAEQTDPQILHGRRKHRLDIWGQGRRQGLRSQIGVKKLHGPSVFTWGNRCYDAWWRSRACWIPCSS